ncbi:MAG: Ig-like domain-containing protein [Cytophagales bacterium]
MKRKISIGIVVIVQILMATINMRCASISPPSGGNQDTIRPKITKQFPLQNSTEFKGRKVKLVFSEPISSKELKKNIIINPIEENFKITQKGLYEIEIEFDSTLKENTTYVINLNEGVYDLTEKNKPLNDIIRFTTGKTLDTFQLKGIVKNLFTNEEVENARIFLFDKNDSLMRKPLYTQLTNETGSFSFYNLKKDKYFVVASIDNKLKFNNNRNQLLDFTYSVDSLIELNISRQNLNNLKISQKKNIKYIELELNKGLVHFEYISKNEYYKFLDKNKILLVPKVYDEDTLLLKTIDSLNISKIDTIIFKPNMTDKETRNFIHKYDVSKDFTFKIYFTHFHKSINTDSIIFSINGKKKPFNIKNIQENNFSYRNNDDIDSVDFIIKPKAFISSLGDTNKLESIKWRKATIQETENSISCIIDIKEKNFITELYTKDGKIIATEKNKKDITFKNLNPGKYRIRVIIDENNNDYWDCGNINKRIKAERIIHHPKEIELRENWEIKDIHIK